jgi:hypothetical protein
LLVTDTEQSSMQSVYRQRLQALELATCRIDGGPFVVFQTRQGECPMLKIIAVAMASMDGAMQSPGASNDPHHYGL